LPSLSLSLSITLLFSVVSLCVHGGAAGDCGRHGDGATRCSGQRRAVNARKCALFTAIVGSQSLC
jgi:hypothetical protein